MDIVEPNGELLVVSELGFGKRTPLKHYNPHRRGTGGMKTMNVTQKTRPVGSAQVVRGDEELMLISARGIVIRTEPSTIVPKWMTLLRRSRSELLLVGSTSPR